MTEQKKKVFVGISGGVDSSVTAALLLKQGLDVTGVFIETWQPPFLECTMRDDRRDAMRVCAKLRIPFLLCDGMEAYKSKVVDYMVSEYSKGRTPNPDIFCNKFVKFGVFYDFAMNNGADLIATGHYAHTERGRLFKAKDHSKDQSYFISQVPNDKLEKTLFPLGALLKSEVRNLAKKFDLHTAYKKDSQGLCFMGKVDVKDFLKRMLIDSGVEVAKGDVLNSGGGIIGEHDGAAIYTIGERHGFRIHTSTPNSEPLYVLSKDITNNTLTVGRADDSRVFTEITLENLNILNKDKLSAGEKLDLIYRYHGQEIPAEIVSIDENQGVMKLGKGLGDLALGQFAAIYIEDECVMSGTIANIR